MRATALPVRFVLLLAGLAAGLALLLASEARADVRRAVLEDGVDPTLTYDLERVSATLDRSAGTLAIRIRLHRPFPTRLDGAYWAASIAVSVSGAPSGGDCLTGRETTGATRLFIDSAQPSPTAAVPEIHRAGVAVAFREEVRPIALTFGSARLTASAVVEDELLRGADLRCLSATSSGRTTADPTQPGGGPRIEQPAGTYFAGFSPRARFRKAVRRCAIRHDRRQQPRRYAACKRRARERFEARR